MNKNAIYATDEESQSVMRQATPDEIWLEQQLNRIAPERENDTQALIALVFELKAQIQ